MTSVSQPPLVLGERLGHAFDRVVEVVQVVAIARGVGLEMNGRATGEVAVEGAGGRE